MPTMKGRRVKRKFPNRNLRGQFTKKQAYANTFLVEPPNVETVLSDDEVSVSKPLDDTDATDLFFNDWNEEVVAPNDDVLNNDRTSFEDNMNTGHARGRIHNIPPTVRLVEGNGSTRNLSQTVLDDVESMSSDTVSIGASSIEGVVICMNCHREQCEVLENNICVAHQCAVSIHMLDASSHFYRRKYCTLKKSDISSKLNASGDAYELALCEICQKYLKTDIPNNSMADVWPVMVWKWIINSHEHESHHNMWSLLPLEWRRWWLREVQALSTYSAITLFIPEPIFVDVTHAKNKYDRCLERLKLSELVETIDELLLSCIKCPWGCDACYDDCGSISMEIVIGRCWGQSAVNNTSIGLRKQINMHAIGMRDDFLTRHDDFFLFNPQWKVMPSLFFNAKGCPVVLTCPDHNGGDKYKYLHVPRNPHGTLPSMFPDQLAPAVLQSRRVKAVKAKKFSTIYSMHKMQVSFGGIDTLRVVDQGRFDISSILLQQQEDLTVFGRRDIRALLGANGINSPTTNIPDLVKDEIIESSKMHQPTNMAVTAALQGTTYVTLFDALRMQIMLKEQAHPLISAASITGVNAETGSSIVSVVEVEIENPWPAYMINVHPYNKQGAMPIHVSLPTRRNDDTRLLWFMRAMHLLVPEIWRDTVSTVKNNVDWHGWILLSCLKDCTFFPRNYNRAVNIAFPNSLRNKQEKFETTLLQRVGVIPWTEYEALEQNATVPLFDLPRNGSFHVSSLIALFMGQAGVATVENSVFSNIEISADVNIIVLLRDNKIEVPNAPVVHQFQRQLELGGNSTFEARFIGVSNITDGYKWSGTVYSRHGGTKFPHWWQQTNSNPVISLDVKDIESEKTNDWDVVVYIREKQMSHEKIRDMFLESCGGQAKVWCKEHNLPHITAPFKNNYTCSAVAQRCTKPVRFQCPDLTCESCCCGSHFKHLVSTTLVAPIFISAAGNDNNSVADDNSQNGNDTSSEGSQNEEDSYSSESVALENLPILNAEQNIHATSQSLSLFDDDATSSSASSQQSNTTETTATTPNDAGNSKNNLEFNLTWSNCIEDNCVFDGNDDNLMDDDSISETSIIEDDNGTIAGGLVCTVAKGLPTNVVTKQGSSSVPGHVILNQCGTLLARKHQKYNGTLQQRHFLQKIVSSTPGKSTPLAYPESVLFPSIFWSDDGSGGDGAILGAMPCAMLSSDRTVNSMGIANIQKHLQSRINNSSLLCSTDDRYISYAFDSCLNLNCRENDTRVILHRGLPHTGLGSRTKHNDSVSIFDTDTVDSRPVVNKLASAVRQEQATYFYTHTCNQRDHFGIRRLKRWIDSDELCEILLANIRQQRQNCTLPDADIIREVTESAARAAAVATLRNWMIVSRIWMTYIARSEEQPLGKVKNIWYRHEFQDSAGNLSHIHALIWIERAHGDLSKVLEKIRGGILDLIHPGEIDQLIDESLIGSIDDAMDVQEKAWRILRHVCTERCKKRVGTEDGELQCRVENNGICNPTPLQHSMQNIHINRSEQCLEILQNLDLLKIENNSSVHEYLHDALTATKHYPPAQKSDGKISACNGRLFVATLSSQNLKYVTGYLTSRYLAKYVALVDEHNKVTMSASRDSPTTLEASYQFLHNTKITGSAIQENKKNEQRKNRHHPAGRAISMMEMLCVILKYEQVFTDIKFVHVPTTPLEERPGIEKVPRAYRLLSSGSRAADLSSTAAVSSFKIRNEEMRRVLPMWRKISDVEKLLMKDQLIANLSVDNTTVFGLRPPELRFVRHQSNFFRWFYRQPISAKVKDIVELNAHYRESTNRMLNRTAWIDGLGYQLYIRPNAISEIVAYLEQSRVNADFYAFDMSLNNETTDNENPKQVTLRMFEQLLLFWNTYGSSSNESSLSTSSRENIAHKMLHMFIGPARNPPNDIIPVVYYNNIRPTQPNRWILHILLSMGEFDNELNLLAAGSIRNSFIRAKLIPGVESEWRTGINTVLKRYIIEQLVFVPGGSKSFDRFVAAAQQALTQYILFNGGMNDEIPAVLFSHIKEATGKKIASHMLKCKDAIVGITLQQLSQKGLVGLPAKQQLMSASLVEPIPWATNLSASTTESQSADSVAEQTHLLQRIELRFNQYLSGANGFAKGIVVIGGPGVGKTTVMQIAIIHAIRRGLNVLVTAVMAERAAQLGGNHIAKTFGIPVRSHSSPVRIAELSILRLLKIPFLLQSLREVDILFIDELGQVSAELLSTLDIVLRRIRSSSLFMGGILLVASMDGQQLQPVKGRPPLLSPHMLTSFHFCKLRHYVRSSQDEHLQQIQDITRLLNVTPADVATFRHLIETHCTFVDSFDDDKILPHMLRIFGKKDAIRFAETAYVSLMRSRYAPNQFVQSVSNDQQSNVEGNWIDATTTTSKSLSRAVKEPQVLSFYPRAQYEVTYNSDAQFSQGQLAVLRTLPSEQAVAACQPVQLYLAPEGCKFVHPDLDSEAQFSAAGWKLIQMGSAPDRIHFINHRIQAKRRQYGLRHRIATTIHAAMGQDVPFIVTRVDSSEPQYMLWEHEQLVVLLSRTHFAKNIIFVGNPSETSAALATLLRQRSQFSDYIGYLLNMYTQDANPDDQTLQIRSIDFAAFPYRPVDVELPTSTNGYVYLLVSARDPSFTYIGQTRKLVRRLRQHNTGHGSTSTNHPELYPWALLGFICGFEGTPQQCTQQRLIIEQRWKTQRNLTILNTNARSLEPDEIATIGRNLQLEQGEGSASLNYVVCGTISDYFNI